MRMRIRSHFYFLLFVLAAMPWRGQATSLDVSFAIGEGANGAVNAIVVDANGKIWVGGEFTTINGYPCAHLARLFPNGTLDTSEDFSVNGAVARLALQTDGKVLVAGDFSLFQGEERRGLARVLTNGVLDLDFDPNSALAEEERVFALGLQPDGKILCATSAAQGDSRVFRLLGDGQPDPNFESAHLFDDYVFTFALGTNGSVLVGGKFVTMDGMLRRALVLLGSNGIPDMSYNAQLDPSSVVFSLAKQSSGSVLVGGSFASPYQSLRPLARLTPGFEWDETFETDPFDPNSVVPWVGLILPQPDDSMVVVGKFFEVGGYWRRHLVRLDAQGRVDPCFDVGLGIGGFDGVRTVVQQNDGRLLVGGLFEGADGHAQPSNLVRMQSQGKCGATRVYLIENPGGGTFVLGTYPPGGTNYLQMSTNMVDWTTVDTQTGSAVFHMFDPAEQASAFFRVKKSY